LAFIFPVSTSFQAISFNCRSIYFQL